MKTKFYAGSEPIKKIRLLSQQFERKVILAGGALREDYMGKSEEIADYDIFVQDLTVNSPNEFLSIDDRIMYVLEKVFPLQYDCVQLFDSVYLTPQEQYEETLDFKPGPNNQIVSVWEVDENETTYQIIFVQEDPVVHVNKYFDIGFCKAYTDGTKIRYTDDFLRDARNKTLTIVGDDMAKQQVEYAITHHADKIIKKYPGWKIVVPSRYQEFAKGLILPR